MLRASVIFAGLSLLAAALPAEAAPRALDLPAGPLRDALAALGQQAGISVAVDDATLWRRRVPAVRGTMEPGEALRRLVRGSNARVIALGGAGWRIVAGPPPPRPPVARAAPAPPPGARDDDQAIVVTASKRETRLGEFAGSVTILDGADLMLGGERGMESILARLASLSSTHLGAGRNKLFIRGIADSSFTGPTQATVGQYLGDMRLTYNAPDPDLRLYDIRSVEVLEGPQGTLYGAGSLGGIIRIVRNPAELDRTSASMSAGLSATQHGDPGGDIGGTVNLPILADTAALRVVGYGIREGGYIDDVLRRKNDVNRTGIYGGRAALRIAPGDGWTIDLGGVFQENHGRDSQYADRDLPRLERASLTDGGFDAAYRLGDVVIGKSWDGLSFLSSTGFVHQNLDERYDASPDGGPPQTFAQRNRTRMFATENRLWRPMRDGFGWVVGASYTRNRTFLGRALGPVDEPLPTTGVLNKVGEITVYGEASVQPRRGLTLTAGARYTHAKLAGAGDEVAKQFEVMLARTGVTASRSEDTFLPSASVALSVVPGITMFARYQEGFRPGGLAIESDIVRRFRNDRVRTMETGLRLGERARDRLDAALSLAYARWDNIQADYVDSAGLPSTNNIGDGRIYSVSASIGWRPLTGLALDAAATYNDSRVTRPSEAFRQSLVNFVSRTDPVAGADLADEPLGRIPNVARFTARFGADYRTLLRDDIELRAAGWLRYTGKSRLGVGPVLGEQQGNYIDTAATIRVGRPDFGVTIGITNLFDAVGNRFALGTPFGINGNQITPLRPRTVRIGIDRAF